MTADTTTTTAGIVRLGEGADLPGRTARLGGKGARLDAMAAAGLPVPPGFCLTGELFDGGDLRPDAVDAVLVAYRELGSPTVAVRSSAAAEDGTTASAAGVHETVLGVTDPNALLDAVRTCLASAVSERSRAYHGDGGTAMAVVVQRLVDAETSGVLFTRDPMRPEVAGVLVEACWGAGEGIVQGRVRTDRFRLDPSTGAVLERTVADKIEHVVVRHGTGPQVVETGASRRRVACLDENRLAELARVAATIRDAGDVEIDVEFCVADGRVWVVQSRPITATAAPATGPRSPYACDVPERVRERTMWSRMDIGEIFNGIMTPMGLGLARHYQDEVHPGCVRSTGMADLGDRALHMGYLGGHVYLNVSYTAHIVQQAPPQTDQTPFTERFRSEQTADVPYENPFGDFPTGPRRWLGHAFWVASSVRETLTMKARARAMTAQRHREYDRARAEDPAALSRDELARRFSEALGWFRAMHVGYMPFYFNATGVYKLLDDLCRSWLNGASADEVVDSVKSNMSALRTVHSAADLADLARAAAELPEVVEALTTLPGARVREALAGTAQGREFVERHVEPFLREHGTRGSQEMELSRPRWVDDWTYVLSMVANYLSQPGLLETVERHTRNRPDGEDLLAGLPRHRRAVLRSVIDGYTTFSTLREITRMSMVTSIWLLRRLVVELARRAAADGLIDDVDDVWMLDFGRLRRHLDGELGRAEFFSRDDVDAGRELHRSRLEGPEPPLTVFGTWDGRPDAPRNAPDADTLAGFGTSAGSAQGPARVITDMHAQAGGFRSGEVLVAPFTDASWTPLFAMATGVVVDTGSMLSHSSIVARELRLPSVVNTGDGTSVIRTGDVVRVDGDAGVVHIVRRAGDTP